MVRKYLFYLFILSIWMTSCGVEEFDDISTATEEFEPEVVYVNNILTKARSTASSPNVAIECITVPYPFQMVDAAGNLFNVNSSVDFALLVSDSSANIVDFAYPLTIVDNIGIEVIVQDLWDFASHCAGCFPDSLSTGSNMFPAYVINFQNSCYSLEYPLNVQNAEGDIYTIADERNFIQKHAAEPLYFIFPLTLSDIQNQKFVAYDAFSLAQLLMACNGPGWQHTTFIQIDQFAYYACYEFVFPINILVFGQTTPVTIPDAATLGNVFMQGRFIDFGYPITLKTINGEFKTANNQTELTDLANQCSLGGDFFILIYKTKLFSTDPCYDLIFPVSASKLNGPTITFQSYPEINSFMFQDSTFSELSTNYPVSIVLTENNQTKVLQSLDELANVYVTCPE
ncbi:MAG TPA: hypothetical protein PKD51_09340 [Saprospiraceae bacterium]|nr:hypothetical protein [Saprospiraceae bacterium]